MENMGVWQGLSNPYPLQTKISVNFEPLAESFQNIHPITQENEFLAVYICIIKKKK